MASIEDQEMISKFLEYLKENFNDKISKDSE